MTPCHYKLQKDFPKNDPNDVVLFHRRADEKKAPVRCAVTCHAFCFNSFFPKGTKQSRGIRALPYMK